VGYAIFRTRPRPSSASWTEKIDFPAAVRETSRRAFNSLGDVTFCATIFTLQRYQGSMEYDIAQARTHMQIFPNREVMGHNRVKGNLTAQTTGALWVAPSKYVSCSLSYDCDGLPVFCHCLKYLTFTSSKVGQGKVRSSISTTLSE